MFDTLQFRVLRDRLYEYLESVQPEAEAGFDLAGQLLDRHGAGLAATHAPPGAAGRGRCRRYGSAAAPVP